MEEKQIAPEEDQIIDEELNTEDKDLYGSEDGDEDYFEDGDYNAEEELFKENPLKALWIRLGEIKELLEDV